MPAPVPLAQGAVISAPPTLDGPLVPEAPRPAVGAATVSFGPIAVAVLGVARLGAAVGLLPLPLRVRALPSRVVFPLRGVYTTDRLPHALGEAPVPVEGQSRAGTW